MTTRTTVFRLLIAALLTATLALGPVPEAAAAGTVRDTVLGARIEDSIAAGEVDAFRVPLLAGTGLRARLETEDDDVPGKDGGGGPLPTLVVLDAQNTELGSVPADGAELRIAIPAAATYRVEVRAGAYSGGYEVRIEGDEPAPTSHDTRSTVTLAGVPTVVHVPAAAGSTVQIEVRRRSGAAPRVDHVSDSIGRELTVFVRGASSGRLRLEPIPVAVAGGLDVTLSAEGAGSGTYELRARVEFESERPSGGDDHDSRHVVVRLASGADPQAIADANGWTLLELKGDDQDIAVFLTPEGRDGHEQEDADDARGSPGVLDASADVIALLPEGSQSNAPVVGSVLGRTDVTGQVALQQMHAAASHAISTGAGAVVAVLDGGVDAAHEFLAGHVLAGFDFVDGDADASDVLNGVDDDGDSLVDEGFGHGTFVASLVLAAAPGAQILPVRVLDSDGRGRSSDIAAGIEWAVDHGADVLNLSFGTLGGSAPIAAAIDYARARGVSVVAATGNAARTSVIDVPAALGGVIGVTALDALGRRAAFANAGAATAIAAPGTDIVGAFPAGRYAHWSGTSFAAAFVSGGVALVLGDGPAVPPARVAALLARRARPVARTVLRADRRALGSGVLDLARLVK